MRKQKQFTIGDKNLTAYELTAQQIKQIMDAWENNKDIHVLNMLFPDMKVPAEALWLGMEMTEEALLEFPPSEISLMIPEVEALNPTLAGLIERLAKIGNALLEKTSAEQSAG